MDRRQAALLCLGPVFVARGEYWETKQQPEVDDAVSALGGPCFP